MEDFQYVVEKPKPGRICFGSALKRDTNPIGDGLSPFQRRYRAEMYEKLSPCYYNSQNATSSQYQLLNKVRSRRGVSGLASGSPQFPEVVLPQVPSPNRYSFKSPWEVCKVNKVPFCSATFRKFPIFHRAPGIGTYNLAAKKCRRTKFSYNFGNPEMTPTVETKCVARPVDRCEFCLKICEGDYWQRNYTTYLCHVCMTEEREVHYKYKEKRLMQFKKIRNCSFMHDHQGTNAAVRLLTKKELLKKWRLENYLDLYLKCEIGTVGFKY